MHIEIQNCFSFWGDFVPQIPYRGFAPGPHWETSVPQTSCTGRPPTFCTRFAPLAMERCFHASRSGLADEMLEGMLVTKCNKEFL